MDTNTESKRKPFLIRLAEQLMTDQQELDDLAVQLSLGKAEAAEQFEATKKKMRNSIHEFKVQLSVEYQEGKEKMEALANKLNHLDEQLASVKADTKKMFNKQKENILQALEDLRSDIKNNPEVLKVADFFTGAAEKTKLQMDIFEKKWDNTRSEISENFKDEMKTARFKIIGMIEKMQDKKDDLDEKLDNFSDEIHEAYAHLKLAIKSL